MSVHRRLFLKQAQNESHPRLIEGNKYCLCFKSEFLKPKLRSRYWQILNFFFFSFLLLFGQAKSLRFLSRGLRGKTWNISNEKHNIDVNCTCEWNDKSPTSHRTLSLLLLRDVCVWSGTAVILENKRTILQHTAATASYRLVRGTRLTGHSSSCLQIRS